MRSGTYIILYSVVEVWEWITNFTPHFNGRLINYPCWVEIKPCQWKGPLKCYSVTPMILWQYCLLVSKMSRHFMRSVGNICYCFLLFTACMSSFCYVSPSWQTLGRFILHITKHTVVKKYWLYHTTLTRYYRGCDRQLPKQRCRVMPYVISKLDNLTLVHAYRVITMMFYWPIYIKSIHYVDRKQTVVASAQIGLNNISSLSPTQLNVNPNLLVKKT